MAEAAASLKLSTYLSRTGCKSATRLSDRIADVEREDVGCLTMDGWMGGTASAKRLFDEGWVSRFSHFRFRIRFQLACLMWGSNDRRIMKSIPSSPRPSTSEKAFCGYDDGESLYVVDLTMLFRWL